jgi:hypothetical protein
MRIPKISTKIAYVFQLCEVFRHTTLALNATKMYIYVQIFVVVCWAWTVLFTDIFVLVS